MFKKNLALAVAGITATLMFTSSCFAYGYSASEYLPVEKQIKELGLVCKDVGMGEYKHNIYANGMTWSPTDDLKGFNNLLDRLKKKSINLDEVFVCGIDGCNDITKLGSLEIKVKEIEVKEEDDSGYSIQYLRDYFVNGKKVLEIPNFYDEVNDKMYFYFKKIQKENYNGYDIGKRFLKECVYNFQKKSLDKTPEYTKTDSLSSIPTQEVSEKNHKALKNQPLFVLVEGLGYKRGKKTYRMFAKELGISNYVGSKLQNIKIKKAILAKFTVKNEESYVSPNNSYQLGGYTNKNTEVSNVLSNYHSMSKTDFHLFKNQPLFIITKHFGFDFRKNRKEIAKYLNISNYVGTRKQNMQMKKLLLEKIQVTE